MGAVQGLCDHTRPPEVQHQQLLAAQIHSDILKKRKLHEQVPRTPIPIQKIILNLIGSQNFEDLYQGRKVWRVKAPYNFVYINEPHNQDREPIGTTDLYIYGDKAEFKGFFRGQIDELGHQLTQGSIWVYENGDHFIGDKIKQNYGKYIDEKNKYDYEGDWCNNYPHGKGIEKSSKGTYSGYFFNGKKQGYGVFENKNEVYEGQFKDNEIHGEGKLQKKDGSQYQYHGSFCKGQKHGEGKQTTPNFEYQGHFFRDQRSGKGVLRSQKQNCEYSGQFQGGQPHGKGKMTKQGEREIEGCWEHGNLICVLKIC